MRPSVRSRGPSWVQVTKTRCPLNSLVAATYWWCDSKWTDAEDDSVDDNDDDDDTEFCEVKTAACEIASAANTGMLPQLYGRAAQCPEGAIHCASTCVRSVCRRAVVGRGRLSGKGCEAFGRQVRSIGSASGRSLCNHVCRSCIRTIDETDRICRVRPSHLPLLLRYRV